MLKVVLQSKSFIKNGYVNAGEKTRGINWVREQSESGQSIRLSYGFASLDEFKEGIRQLNEMIHNFYS